MAKPNPITIPKQVFLDLHPAEAELFRQMVISGAFKLAMSTAMAQFMASTPTQEQCSGAMLFRQVFEGIGEVTGQPIVARGRPLSQSGRTPMPYSSQDAPAPSTAPTQPPPTTPNPRTQNK